MEDVFIESVNQDVQNIELMFSDVSFEESNNLECAPPIIRMPASKPIFQCPSNCCCAQCYT